MIQITVTEEQARLINHCLELYSRLGLGQFNFLKEHWGIQQKIWNKELDHDFGEEELLKLRNTIFDLDFGLNGSHGIGSPKVDEDSRIAFDIQQVIRHELWKQNPNRSDMTVDSSVHLFSNNEDVFKIKAKTVEDEEV